MFWPKRLADHLKHLTDHFWRICELWIFSWWKHTNFRTEHEEGENYIVTSVWTKGEHAETGSATFGGWYRFGRVVPSTTCYYIWWGLRWGLRLEDSKLREDGLYQWIIIRVGNLMSITTRLGFELTPSPSRVSTRWPVLRIGPSRWMVLFLE